MRCSILILYSMLGFSETRKVSFLFWHFITKKVQYSKYFKLSFKEAMHRHPPTRTAFDEATVRIMKKLMKDCYAKNTQEFCWRILFDADYFWN